jgi:hypothetical protein
MKGENIMVRAEEREVLIKDAAGNIGQALSYKAIVNPDNNKLYSILSKDYTILQHDDAISKVQEEIVKNPEFGEYKQEGPFYYKDGARMEIKFIFPEVSIPIRKGDLVHPQVQVLNGYDGGWGFHIIFGAYRVVCSNGLTIGEKVLQVHQRHTQKVNEFLMGNILSDSMHQFSMQTEIWKTWIDKTIEVEEANKKIELLHLSKKREEELRKEIEVSEGDIIEGQKVLNQWIFFNILCQYASHRVSANIRLELSKRIRKMF